jgi:hypothetical protein
MSDMKVHLPVAPPVRGAEPASGANAQPCEPPIEFRALLERLREQAAALEKATEKTLSAGELSGAVQDAGASLQGALSIAEGLLEAYRSSRVASS